MRKIHCEEVLKRGFFTRPSKIPAHEMIGFVYPVFGKKGTRKSKVIEWEVVLIEGGYTCRDQDTAQIISSLEEIKALLLKYGRRG